MSDVLYLSISFPRVLFRKVISYAKPAFNGWVYEMVPIKKK